MHLRSFPVKSRSQPTTGLRPQKLLRQGRLADLDFVGELEQRSARARARRKPSEKSMQQVHPGRDEDVLTSWKGLILVAFAGSAQALGHDDC